MYVCTLDQVDIDKGIKINTFFLCLLKKSIKVNILVLTVNYCSVLENLSQFRNNFHKSTEKNCIT